MKDNKQHIVPVLILNFNGWDDTFANIRNISPYVDAIWLIDNGSDIDRTKEAESLFPGLRTIRIAENKGWAGGYNIALAQARREDLEYVYLLNNDAVPHRGAIEAVLSTISSATDIAAVGSVILEGDGTHAWYDGDYWDDHQKLATDVDPGIRNTNAINGAGFILNLKAIADIGDFHEDYFLYHEETDWCVLARLHGWRILVNGSSFVTHAREGSNVSHNSSYYRCRNTFLLAHRGTSPDVPPLGRPALIRRQMGQIARLHGGARLAAADGLVDGLAGRFGKRQRSRNPVRRVMLSVFGAVLSGIYDLSMRDRQTRSIR